MWSAVAAPAPEDSELAKQLGKLYIWPHQRPPYEEYEYIVATARDILAAFEAAVKAAAERGDQTRVDEILYKSLDQYQEAVESAKKAIESADEGALQGILVRIQAFLDGFPPAGEADRAAAAARRRQQRATDVMDVTKSKKNDLHTLLF